MKIKGMVLSNFRLFMHDQELQFGFKENRPLTIIRAENRTGKTTLLTALQWCFYGDAVLTNAKQSLSGGDMLVSSDALRKAKPGDTIKTQVLVSFEDNGVDYIAKRVRETKRGEHETDARIISSDSFTLLREDPSGTKIVPNPNVFIQQILPENLRELFLFDGDRINRFMESDHEEAVQRAVSDMLEFELFDEAQRHLKAILGEYRAELRGIASGEAKSLREKQDELENDLDKTGEEISRLEKEKRSEEILEEQYISELAGESGDAGIIQKQINDLREQIKHLEKSSRTLGEDLGRQICQGNFFTVTSPFSQARQLLLDKKEAGEIPRRIGEDLIKERLELGICICGRPLVKGEESHNCLLTLLSQERAAIDEMATDTLYYLNAFSRKDRYEIYQRLDDILSQRSNYQQAIVSLSKQIGELEQQLGKIDVEVVTKRRLALTETRKRIQTLIMSISENQQKARSLETLLAELGKNLRRAEKQDEKNRVLRRREQIAEDCLKALILTYHNVREIERERISRKTEENFFKMNLRENEFEHVEVTPSFRLQVIAPGGYIANSVLSGAQRRALSLAFLFALMQVSERDAPVVVDTPLGMTSGPMRRSITQSMIDQTEQLILLLTRSEIQGVEDILKANAAKQITLSCSQDYPTELVNQPRMEGAYTEACECGIDSHCSMCERVIIENR